MEKNVNVTSRTLADIKKEFLDKVAAYNASEDVSERASIKKDVEKLTEDYNKTSKHTSYAKCLDSETPMLDFIKTYTYPVISASVKKGEIELTVKKDGVNVHDLWDFVEFCEGRDVGVAAKLDWKSKATAAQNALIEQVQGYVEDGTEMNPGNFKVALQDAFNSVVFVEGAKGNNAVIATSKNVRVILMTCGRLDNKNFKAQFAGEKAWQKQFFACLNCAVKGKTFDTIYGEETTTTTDEEATKAETEAPKAETKSKGKGKGSKKNSK